MSKSRLSEAAADILRASVSKAGSEKFDQNKPPVTTPGQNIQDLGTAGHTTKDEPFDATKGAPRATPPGATPPVGSEPLKKLAKQPQEMGSANEPEGGETSETDKVNRKKGPMPKETNPANKNSVKPYVPESEEEEDEDPILDADDEDEGWDDEEELEEATMEEVEKDLKELSDDEFKQKYGMSKKAAEAKISAPPTSAQSSVKEDIDAIFAGETLSEEFKEKATLIFEAAVNARVELVSKELEEAFVSEFEKAVDEIKEDFATKLDTYLDYVVENWMQENEIAVESGIRSEIAEDFMEALKNLFVEHYIDIPETKVDVVEELISKVEALESKLDEQIEKNVELKSTINEHKKLEAIHEACAGLTLSQVEKVTSLASSIEFVSEEDFSNKLETIVESYFPQNVKSATADDYNEPIELDEEVTTKVVDPLVEQYAKKIGKLTKF
jgi:hypothetical protein